MLFLQKTTTRHLFFIIFIALLVTLPSLFYGVFDAHDIKVHLLWSNGFSRQFWQGDLYPRWLSDSNAGLGSPSFFFYPPLPYYITSLFHPLFAGDTSGWLTLASSACLSLVLSGITAYFWLGEIATKSAALIGAIAYMLLPYHLSVNLYLRFAFAEYWALVWLPLILYFTVRFVKGSRLSFLGIILSFSLLFFTHLLTLMIFAFVPVLYGIILSTGRQRIKTGFSVFIALFLGLGLSAVYWITAITTQDNISVGALWPDNPIFYETSFLFVSKQFPYRLAFWNYLELLNLFMGAIVILSCFLLFSQKVKNSKLESGYWVFISCISIFMMTPLSKWFWDIFTILQKIQFPWRFHTLLTLSTSAIIALIVSSQELKILNYLRNYTVVLFLTFSIGLTSGLCYLMYTVESEDLSVIRVFIFLFLALLPIFIALLIIESKFGSDRTLLALAIGAITIAMCLNGVWAIGQKFNLGLVLDDNIVKPERLSQILELKQDPAEYRPRWFSTKIGWSNKELKKLSQSINRANVLAGQGNITIKKWQPRNIILEAQAKTRIFVTLGQFYYQGWHAKILPTYEQLAIYSDRGLLGIKIPEGKHRISVRLKAGMEERIGRIVSLISVIITLALLVRVWHSSNSERKQI
ncbi:MAG: YfhO family protein [Cyanobacteria bacterium SBLK]|nr:YfhO family protein [Cyanobacteria bacterium SBLK]